MRKCIKTLAIIISLLIILVFGMSAYVTMTTSGNIAGTDRGNGISQESIDECKSIEPQCILVLGCAVFMVDRVIIVTQKYHLYRALKACDALGITARGIASNQQKYAGRFFREAREILARDKDIVKGLIKAKPTFLGDEIPVEGDGTVTHLNSSQDAFEGSLGAE
jgi:vancomycin permeability regulator SanA